MRKVLTLAIIVWAIAQMNAQPNLFQRTSALRLVTEYQLDEYSGFREANTPERVDLFYAPKLITSFQGSSGFDTLRFKYDLEGRLLSREEISSYGVYRYSVYYQYDALGRVTHYQLFYNKNLMIDQQWVYNQEGKPISLEQTSDSKLTVVKYFYDVNGNEIKRSERYLPKDNGVSGRFIYSSFDAFNRLSQRVWYKEIDSSEVPEKRELFLYTAPESTQILEIAVWKNSAWVNTEMLINYDSLSILKSVTQRLWRGDTWKDTLRTIKHFTATGELKDVRNEFYNAGVWWLKNIEYNIYDTLGRVTAKVFDKGVGENQLPYDRTLYTYDSTNNIISEELQWWYNNSYLRQAQNSSKYDSKGNSILTSYYVWFAESGGGKWLNYPGKLIIRYNKGKSFLNVNGASADIVYSTYTEIENLNKQEVNFTLCQNYPNPFNPSTTVDFEVPTSGMVTLKVYDVLGGEIMTLVNEMREVGKHSISFDASNLPSGVYFYKLQSGEFVSTKKMVLVK